MSLTVKLYNDFAKRDNSTKRPGSDAGSSFGCSLIDSCSIEAPTIEIEGLSDPAKYNYAYIAAFDRYYFVTRRTWTLGLWRFELQTDVLATFKSEIGSSTQYIVRSSHSYDGNITDSLYPTISNDQSSMTSIGAPLAGNLSTGTYVIGIINENGGMGAIEYFALSASEFESVCAVMFASNPSWYDLTGIVKSTPADVTEIAFPTEVMKSLVNPMQYVTSCMYFPAAADVPLGSTKTIKFGWWSSGISGHKLGENGRSFKSGTFTLTAHPQASSRGNYLNLSPYTRTMFNAGLFGYFPIDMTYFAGDLDGSFTIGIDAITGEGVLFIKNDPGDVISVHRAQVGVPIKMAQITRDYLQTAANVVGTAADITGGVAGTIGAALTGNIPGAVQAGAGTIGSGAAGIVSSIKSAMPTLTATGSGGSMYELHRGWTITQQYFLLAEEDNANRGRPLAKKKQISTIPGYIQVADPDLATWGTAEDTAQVRSYMAGGFFYE